MHKIGLTLLWSSINDSCFDHCFLYCNLQKAQAGNSTFTAFCYTRDTFKIKSNTRLLIQSTENRKILKTLIIYLSGLYGGHVTVYVKEELTASVLALHQESRNVSCRHQPRQQTPLPVRCLPSPEDRNLGEEPFSWLL